MYLYQLDMANFTGIMNLFKDKVLVKRKDGCW